MASTRMRGKGESKMQELAIKGLCAVCNSPGSKSCSGCQSVNYCSSEHQKSDWSKHKNNCSPFILKTNEEFGRHYIAARTLKPGTLVVEESPAFCGPRGLIDDFATPICLSCCVLMEDESAEYRCSKCKWPTCCWNCEQHKLHSQNECKIFEEKKISFPPSDNIYPVYVTYKVIEILRGVILKENEPDLWAKIMDLQYETDLGSHNEMFKDLTKLRRTFGVDDIEKFGDDEDWRRILGVLNVNNFSIEGRRGGDGPSFTSFLFPKSSMLAHSCAPNCWWGISMFPKYTIQIRTTVEVQKGEILTIPYSYIYNSFGTHKRQELIQNDGEFVCKCRRCLDPTELNSFASALVCEGCKRENVLPINPIDLESDWKCHDCSETYTATFVNQLLDDLMSKLESCEVLTDMENFITVNQGKTIHTNHWLITEAEEVMCNIRTRSLLEKDEMALEVRDSHISLCEHLLKIKNLIAPGFSLERARLLNHLARARFEKLEYVIAQNILENDEEIAVEADFIYILYNEALHFYQNDNTEVPSGETFGLKCRSIMSDMRLVKERFSLENQPQEST